MTGEHRNRRRIDASLLDESTEDLYEHAPCGYLSTLPDGTIAKVNQTLLEWTGYRRESLVHVKRFQALLSVGSQIYFETHFAPLLRMQGAVNEVALEIVCSDGRSLPVIVNSVERKNEQGEPLFTRITLFDSTDRRRYERELLLARRKAEQAAKDKADLLSMLSHDIRNPLNAIMGVVQLLDRGDLTESQRRCVRLLKSSSGNMLGLLDRVLALSRVESGNITLEQVPFAIGHIVEDVLSTFQAQAAAKGLTLTPSIDEGIPAMLGDPISLRQILTNLVGNAVKFTEKGGVTVSVQMRETDADTVTFSVGVADTGIGIAPDQVERIMNEFTQASYETAVKFGGTGLGLAITRKLLAVYGSQVHVTSTPGQGSTLSFTLRLPVAANR